MELLKEVKEQFMEEIREPSESKAVPRATGSEVDSESSSSIGSKKPFADQRSDLVELGVVRDVRRRRQRELMGRIQEEVRKGASAALIAGSLEMEEDRLQWVLQGGKRVMLRLGRPITSCCRPGSRGRSWRCTRRSSWTI